MFDDTANSSNRVLDPLERFSEILFGVIMVLTFTVSLRVARADRAQVHEMLVGASVLPQPALDALRLRLNQLPEPPSHPHLTRDDWRGGVAVFLLVFLSTFPIVIPFIVLPQRIRLAAHISDAIALAMLFLSGYAYGRYAGHSPRGWGLSMVVIGGVMVGLTIALGG